MHGKTTARTIPPPGRARAASPDHRDYSKHPGWTGPGKPPGFAILFGRTPICPWVMDPRIRAAIELIEKELEKDVRVSDLAARLGWSRSRLEHLFRDEVGTTIRRFVQALRVAKAKLLLPDLSLRVEQVAWKCGYEHTSSLDHEFKREFGISPSEYRRSTSEQEIAR